MIAAKFGIKDSSDLAMAAIARLVFVGGKDSCKTQEIRTSMRTAKSYFKSHHGNNLSRTLRGLMRDGKLNEISTDTFALSADAKTELETKIRA